MGNNIDKICTGLYAGGLMGATKKDVMASNNITHILTLIEGGEQHFPNDFKYKRVDVADHPNSNLSRHFRECVDFIHDCRINGGSCYVHCVAGISRAITICTMYVLTISTLNYEESLTVVQYSRKVANPNFGFRMQLKKYCREQLEEERKELKKRFPQSTLDDDNELKKKLIEAQEAFAKEGQPPLLGDEDKDYIAPIVN